MSDYILSLKSQRSTFTIGFEAADDNAAIDHAKALVEKARAPAGAKVTIVRPDGTEMDVSGRLSDAFDRPKF